MKSTLIDLFTSKKFLAAATAIIVYVAGRFGFNVDPTTLDHIWQALLVYVGAQGVADLGKSAALVNAAAANDNAAAARAPVSSAAATAAMFAVIVLGLCAAGSMTACATIKADAAVGKASVVDCVKGDRTAIEALLGELAWDGIEQAAKLGAPDWNALVTAAEARGVAVGGCAFAEFLARRPAPPAPSSGTAISALSTPPPAPDPATAALERLRAGFGGVKWSTSAGVL